MVIYSLLNQIERCCIKAKADADLKFIRTFSKIKKHLSARAQSERFLVKTAGSHIAANQFECLIKRNRFS